MQSLISFTEAKGHLHIAKDVLGPLESTSQMVIQLL